MTSSDDTALSPGALEAVASRVGESHCGDAGRAADSAGGARLALLCSKFNGGITERLVDGALRAAADHGVAPTSVEATWVPGAFELPLAAAALARSGRADAVVALGAVIRGETAHFEYVAGQCAAGLQRAALDTGVPVVFGVLTTEDVAQAMSRSGAGHDNKGYEATLTALEMIDLLAQLATPVG